MAEIIEEDLHSYTIKLSVTEFDTVMRELYYPRGIYPDCDPWLSERFTEDAEKLFNNINEALDNYKKEAKNECIQK